jgi:Holliday junction resolvase RusA-like endonuclease
MARTFTLIEKTVAFTVPLVPPSVNHMYRIVYYRAKNGQAVKGRKLTKAAEAFRFAVGLFAQGRTVAPATDKERLKVRYEVRVTVYLGPRQRGDADNFLKAAQDALEACGVIHSDAYVYESKAIVVKDERHNPRTEFVVTRLERE